MGQAGVGCGRTVFSLPATFRAEGTFPPLRLPYGRHLPWKGRLFLYYPSKDPPLGAAPTSNGKSGGSAETPRLPGRSCGGVKTPPYNPTEDPNAPQNHDHRTGQRAPRKVRTTHKTATIRQSGEIHSNSKPKSQTTNCVFLIIWESLGPAGQTCKGFTCGLAAEGLYW